MEQNKLGVFIERLKEEKAKILNQRNKINKEHLMLSQDDLADEVDLASSELNQSVTLRLHDRDRGLLKKIEIALQKIELGTFGICEDCEEPIEMKRLLARPIAELCIHCKELQESQQKVIV